MVYHARSHRIAPDEYISGRGIGIVRFLAGIKTTKENRTTRFVSEVAVRKQGEEIVYHREMESGDTLIMFTSMHHAGSVNTSYESRLGYTTFNFQGSLR